ncbi:copper homeostasis periplasmic binding protein CopC [Bradyrhizobium zhanjiangense]|uniref:Copper resistance protein CopC n=1 Tax=Bradyrhizobium zhanjiangense TaxID=1325107 RepID=A0A4Q0QWI2_9BRAD|nr:copper homeostasis periplasmic binding protein CopC [Bradyrhizobium zhanjiangense]RXH01550.1 copper resistance protein CopC [Bradyrhizobium zhanjiangense]
MRARLLAISTGIGLALAATEAMAHPKLTSSAPPSDGIERAAPTTKEIRLNFSEGVIAKFSGLELRDESGKSIATGTPAVDLKDKKQLVVPLDAPLPAGKYRVIWHAVSEDTHRVKGEYTFTIGN